MFTCSCSSRFVTGVIPNLIELERGTALHEDHLVLGGRIHDVPISFLGLSVIPQHSFKRPPFHDALSPDLGNDRLLQHFVPVVSTVVSGIIFFTTSSVSVPSSVANFLVTWLATLRMQV